jgi:hypothetical protein
LTDAGQSQAGAGLVDRRTLLGRAGSAAALTLSGCGPVGAIGDVISRDQKDRDRQALAEKIRRHWLAKDAQRFGDLKVSVSYSNDWQRLFATQYTLVLTGTVREEWDRELALILAREALGVAERQVYVTNSVRVVP